MNNKGKRFNVKFPKRETIPLKNESLQTTQVDYAKRFDQRLAPCGIIPDANSRFQILFKSGDVSEYMDQHY